MERRFASGTSHNQTQLGLSPREQQVLDLLLRAQSLKEIAKALNVSVNSAKGYVKAIYLKARVHSARELITRHAQSGPPEDEVLASICALVACPTPREILPRCLTALRIWTGAAEATVLDPNRTNPPSGRGFVIPVPAALDARGCVFWLSAPPSGWAPEAAETAEEIVRLAARRAVALTPPRPAPRSQRPAQSPQVRAS
ncbi:MAG: response regulator transcription factor [Terriglobales bacterium]